MDKGLIVGIDLNNKVTQSAFYDEKMNNVVSAGEYSNPSDLREMLDNSNGREPDIKAVSNILVDVLNETLRTANMSTITAVTVLVHDYNINTLNAVKAAIEKIGLKEEQWQIISKTDGFAYYAYNQKKELYAAGVVLMDYTDKGIELNRLVLQKKDNNDYILQEIEYMDSDDICSVAKGRKRLEDVVTELVFLTNTYFEKRITSAVYLTGRGFDVEKLPTDFSKVIVNKKKAFLGQNLFAKGACHASCEMVRKGVLSDVVVLTQDRIKYGLEFDIAVNGQNKRFRVLKAGTNWYMANRTVDFILDDLRNISVKVISPDRTFYDENIDISEIPYREGKTTRISVNIKFLASDRCLITIKDKGFGDFFKSSGKVIYKELEFAY